MLFAMFVMFAAFAPIADIPIFFRPPFYCTVFSTEHRPNSSRCPDDPEYGSTSQSPYKLSNILMANLVYSECQSLFRVRLRASNFNLTHANLHPQILSQLRIQQQYRFKSISSVSLDDLAYHWDTEPATSSQLESATAFFRSHRPRKVWTATEWRKLNEPLPTDSESREIGGGGARPHTIPEVVFLGRSNVGKSSLLNSLLLSPSLNRVGPRPGKTKTMHAWGLLPNTHRTSHMASFADSSEGPPEEKKLSPAELKEVRLSVLDMPGYGHASQTDWGEEILTYLRRRKQLRRAFVLVDALHGFKGGDTQMIRLLQEQGISYQIIVSKVDRLLSSPEAKGGRGVNVLNELFDLLRTKVVQPQSKGRIQQGSGLGEILAVGSLGTEKKKSSSRLAGGGNDMGIEAVRWAVLAAAGLEQYATELSSGESRRQLRRRRKQENLQV